MEHKLINLYKPSNNYNDYDFSELRKTQTKYKTKGIVFLFARIIILIVSLLAFTYIVLNNVSLFSHGSPGVILSKSNIVTLQSNTRRLA